MTYFTNEAFFFAASDLTTNTSWKSRLKKYIRAVQSTLFDC